MTRARAGYSLLELLAATAVTTVLFSLCGSAFVTITRAQTVVDEKLDADRYLRELRIDFVRSVNEARSMVPNAPGLNFVAGEQTLVLALPAPAGARYAIWGALGAEKRLAREVVRLDSSEPAPVVEAYESYPLPVEAYRFETAAGGRAVALHLTPGLADEPLPAGGGELPSFTITASMRAVGTRP